MTNIVLICRDRPRLTEQTLRTLYMNTDPTLFNLTIVDDGSGVETIKILDRYGRKDNCEIVHLLKSVGIVGFLKNVGAWTSERVFGRGDYLCFIDNDIAFSFGWLEFMTSRLDYDKDLLILGGYRHPFHQPIKGSSRLLSLTDAVAGYTHLMRWHTWDLYGPYDQHAVGVCQSEDFAICQKIISSGKYVGYLEPAVIHNCGITNSEGKPAIGAEYFPRIRGLIYE